MKKIIIFQFIILTLIVLAIKFRGNISVFMDFEYDSNFNSLFFTSILALIGSILYCLRAIYVNACVKKDWNAKWETWYYLRPFTGFLAGIGVWVALKAGALVLIGSNSPTNIWFSGFAGFVAGLNVQNILKLIEKKAESNLGVQKSNQSKAPKYINDEINSK